MLLIGEVSERTGLATSAIRYYEDLGLIRPAERASGRRLFAESAPNRLRAIAAAREAGFSLAEIRDLLDSQVEGTDRWRQLVQTKISEVEALVARLQGIRSTLVESLDCGCGAWDQCPILLA